MLKECRCKRTAIQFFSSSTTIQISRSTATRCSNQEARQFKFSSPITSSTQMSCQFKFSIPITSSNQEARQFKFSSPITSSNQMACRFSSQSLFTLSMFKIKNASLTTVTRNRSTYASTTLNAEEVAVAKSSVKNMLATLAVLCPKKLDNHHLRALTAMLMREREPIFAVFILRCYYYPFPL